MKKNVFCTTIILSINELNVKMFTKRALITHFTEQTMMTNFT